MYYYRNLSLALLKYMSKKSQTSKHFVCKIHKENIYSKWSVRVALIAYKFIFIYNSVSSIWELTASLVSPWQFFKQKVTF